MEHTLFLDIETIPSQSAKVHKKFLDEVTPPGNIKKQESIDAWLRDNAESAAQEKIAKTSFDPAFGHICTIAWALDDAEVVSSHADTVEAEKQLLAEFLGSLYPAHNYTIVGHYVGGFDLRFILCRAVVLGVKIPRCIPRDPKPWDGKIFDTMTAWAGQRGTISMDNLCAALGLEGKSDFSGADVAQAWSSGEHQKIAEYCMDDVRKTREIWRKFQAVGW